MNPTDWLKNNWNKPAQGIAAITMAVVSFADTPPEGIAIADNKSLLSLTRLFIIPVIWLILSVPARRFAGKRHAWKWFSFAVVAFMAGIAIWFGQKQLYASWTCHSALLKKQFTVGETFKPTAIDATRRIETMISGREISEAEARQVLTNTPKCELIERAEQDANNVWEPAEISSRRTKMSMLYIAGIPIFVIAMITALQAWYCVGRRN